MIAREQLPEVLWIDALGGVTVLYWNTPYGPSTDS